MVLKSRNKLLLITLIPLLLITTLISVVYYINSSKSLEAELVRDRQELIDARKKELKAYMMMGVTAIKPLYDSDVNGSNKQAAKEILKAMRFESDGYFFAYDSQGINTLHAIKPSLEGKNLYDLKDENGVAVIAGLIDASQKGDGFLYSLGTNQPSTLRHRNWVTPSIYKNGTGCLVLGSTLMTSTNKLPCSVNCARKS